MFLVQFGALENRIDANTYHSERINIIQKLKSTQWELKPLKFVTTFSKNLVSQNAENLVYVGLENIESNTGFYIETSEKESFGTAVKFQKGQVLFPKLRPYLNKVYLAEFEGLCSTEFHILDSKIVDNRYLAIFLRLDVVVNQTKYLMSGNTLPRLQTSDIENLLIPIPPIHTQAQIVGIFEQAYEQKKAKEAKAKRLLESIDGYLLEKLGIRNNISLRNVISEKPHFFVKFSQMQGKRFDPKRYLPENQLLLKSLETSNFEKIALKGLCLQSVAGDWGIDNEQEGFEERLVIRATEFDNLYNLNLENDRVKYRFINKIKLAKMDLQVGDLLIEKSGGSEDQPVGRIAIISQDLTEKYKLAYSNFIHKIRIDTKKINPEYLFAFLKTIHNIKITDIMQSQTNGIRNLIMQEYFKIPIPFPPLEVQNEIADHISGLRAEAKRLENEAKTGLEQAKKEVERLILG